MSEETEGQDTGAEAVAGGVDPAAVALALNGASQKTADAFLNDQRALIADQRHHLHEQLKQLHLGLWEKRLGVLLRVATAVVGIAIAAGIAFMVWEASDSEGLLIEPFSVPPDLAQRGLTGQAVAAKLLDDLAAMQSQTGSQRAPASYANSWATKDIKLDIPETGVSLDELARFLRETLGHDTHVTGELIRDQHGLSLTARAGEFGSQSVTGPDSDTNRMLQQLAEAVYRVTQPYRYGIYIGRHGRADEAIALFREMATSGPLQERPWAYTGWQNFLIDRNVRHSLNDRAVELVPNFALGWENLEYGDYLGSRVEQSLRQEKTIISLLETADHGMIREDAVPFVREMEQSEMDVHLGAFQDAARKIADVLKFQAGRLGGSGPVPGDLVADYALAHDIKAARSSLADAFGTLGLATGRVIQTRFFGIMTIETVAQDWQAVMVTANAVVPALQKNPTLLPTVNTRIVPLAAYAEAKLGKIADAEAHIAATPADCYDCLIARARIAELQGQHARADWWFTRAASIGPSVPFAHSYWGQALLERGKPDEAIEKFTLANQKGPHFADPLEMWGEALMAKNQSHLALAKFEEAEKYAPNWGRLHLKWGEALGYAGKKDEAKAQFVRAAALDLTPSEKAELERHS